jgi:hypothetical protein
MNFLEKNQNEFVICDDLTGKEINVSQRVEIVDALTYIHELYAVLQKSKPQIENFEIHFALHQTCKHFGWFPSEVAAVEHYTALASTLTGTSTPSTR